MGALYDGRVHYDLGDQNMQLLPREICARGKVEKDNCVYNFIPCRRESERNLCARYMHNSSAAENRRIITETMETIAITHLAERQLGELSGGEKQRVFLGFILARQSKVWLLDEPFSALDPAAFRELFTLLVKLKQQYSLTILIVLHDINRALNYGDRIIGMKNGRICFDLPPESAGDRIQQLYDLPDSALQYKQVFL